MGSWSQRRLHPRAEMNVLQKLSNIFKDLFFGTTERFVFVFVLLVVFEPRMSDLLAIVSAGDLILGIDFQRFVFCIQRPICWLILLARRSYCGDS
jgi:hypothetical protein